MTVYRFGMPWMVNGAAGRDWRVEVGANRGSLTSRLPPPTLLSSALQFEQQDGAT
jgi:hypothetical protein